MWAGATKVFDGCLIFWRRSFHPKPLFLLCGTATKRHPHFNCEQFVASVFASIFCQFGRANRNFRFGSKRAGLPAFAGSRAMRDFRWQCFTDAVVAELHDSRDVDTENFRFEARTVCPLDKRGSMKIPSPMNSYGRKHLSTILLARSNFSQSPPLLNQIFQTSGKKSLSKPAHPTCFF